MSERVLINTSLDRSPEGAALALQKVKEKFRGQARFETFSNYEMDAETADSKVIDAIYEYCEEHNIDCRVA